MKNTVFVLLLYLYSSAVISQDITGSWKGALQVMGNELPLVLHIEKTAAGYSSKMDSPKQMAFGLPMSSTTFKNDTLKITDQARGMTYTATYKNEGFIGTFHQNGMKLSLNLKKSISQDSTHSKRPQEPQKPYPYVSLEVKFHNKSADITLAGTLSLPHRKGKFPAVILISGSGPQDRNETLMGHQPFLVLSDYLTRHGIAVLRFDDRGVGASEGNYSTATTADLATDTRAALEFLRTQAHIDTEKIGLIGHSEGGMIAPMVATQTGKVDFLVLLAAPGVPGAELLLQQSYLIGKASGMSDLQLAIAKDLNHDLYKIVTTVSDKKLQQEKLKTTLKEGAPLFSEERVEATVQTLMSPWMQFFLKYDPRPNLQKIDIPVLALNGSKDLQVSPKVNLAAIEKALKAGGNTKVTTILIPQLNHLFQECETGLPSEYAQIEQTFSPKALQVISQWIQKI